MINLLLIAIGKFIIFISRLFNLGNGSTWPGHVALSLNKNFIKEIIVRNKRLKIILITGTNGKTTTGKLIQTILKKGGKKIFQNESGANLLNGLASSLLLHSSIFSTINYDYAIFEIDENTLPLALKEFAPNYLIVLNLFRDQLDRYGEVNTIADKWGDAVKHLLPKTQLILNADDPQVAYLAKNSKTSHVYFGLNDKSLKVDKHQHAVDSTYCPNCSLKLFYNTIYFSHLGDWECNNCNLKRPKLDISEYSYYPLAGIYNRYNTLAAILTAKQIGIEQKYIASALRKFIPAFGRQEKLNIGKKNLQIFLSKNPTSFNESLRTIRDLNAENILLILNDRIPDGLDVSWIWDVDFEDYVNKFKNVVISGDRVYDLALRIKYCCGAQNTKLKIYQDLQKAIEESIEFMPENGNLYILPTYSAMLEVRKILIGKKIL